MSWHYSLAKETKEDKVVYSLIEVFTNDDGGIWGYTGHSDILGWIEQEVDAEDEEDDVDEKIAASILSTLHLVSKDVLTRPILDLDTLETVELDVGSDDGI